MTNATAQTIRPYPLRQVAHGDTRSDISASTFYPLPKNFSSIPLSTMLKGHIPIEIELLNHSHNFRLVKSLFDRTISFGDSGLLFSSNLFEFEVQQLEWKQSRPAFSVNLVYLDLWHNILYGVIPTQVGLLTIARHILIKVLQCIDGIHSIRDWISCKIDIIGFGFETKWLDSHPS